MFNERKDIDKIIKIFKEHNIKVTLQRITIYSYLLSTCEHPTVETIYQNIKSTIPTISLATVYKTLNTFVKAKIVKVLNVCEDNFRYDANLSIHGHVKCLYCNKVDDINVNNLLNLNLLNDYKIDSFDLLLYGKCSTCCSP